MASDVKVKLSADVAGFKKAMTESKTAVKALDAELKLNDAQMKASGKSEELMRERTELLKKEITEQEKAVRAAEKALESMSKAGETNSARYNQMKTAYTNAKTALVNMQAQLKGAATDTNATNAAMEAGAKSADKFAESLRGIGKNVSLDTVRSGIEGVTGAASSALATVSQLAKAVWNMEIESAQYADDVNTMATQYGLDPETVQRMLSAEKLGDVDAQTVLNAADKLYKNISADDLAKLGIDKAGKSRMDLLYEYVDMLQTLKARNTLEDNAAADELAQLAFGKSFRELGTLFEMGSSGYQSILAEQPVVSEEDLTKLNNFNDAVDTLNTKLENLQNNVAATLAPQMETIADAFGSLVDKVSEWAASPEGEAALTNLSEAVAGLITSITEKDLENIVGGATSAISGLTSTFEWIRDNQGVVKTALYAIAGAFAGLKVMKISTDVLSLINGLVSLGGGAGIASGLGSLATSLGTITLTAAAITVLADTVMTYMNGHTEDDESKQEWEDKNLNQGMAQVTTSSGEVMYLPDPKDDGSLNFAGNKYTWEEYQNALNPAYEDEKYHDTYVEAAGGFGPVMMTADALAEWEAAKESMDKLAPVIEKVGHVVTKPVKPEEDWFGSTRGTWDANGWESETLTEWGAEIIQDAVETVFGEASSSWSDDWGSETLSEWGGAMNDKVASGIDENLALLEQSGARMAAAVASGFSSNYYGGGSVNNTSNLYIPSISVNNGVDVSSMIQTIQKSMLTVRAGFGVR